MSSTSCLLEVSYSIHPLPPRLARGPRRPRMASAHRDMTHRQYISSPTTKTELPRPRPRVDAHLEDSRGDFGHWLVAAVTEIVAREQTNWPRVTSRSWYKMQIAGQMTATSSAPPTQASFSTLTSRPRPRSHHRSYNTTTNGLQLLSNTGARLGNAAGACLCRVLTQYPEQSCSSSSVRRPDQPFSPNPLVSTPFVVAFRRIPTLQTGRGSDFYNAHAMNPDP